VAELIHRKSMRVLEIEDALRLKPRTASELAKLFEVPVRNIQRDLKDLRHRELIEVIDETARTPKYRHKTRAHTLTDVQALAAHAAVRLLYHHAPNDSRAYRSMLERLSAFLPDGVRRVLDASLERGQRSPRPMEYDRTLEKVTDAWLGQRILKFQYRKAGGSGTWRDNVLEVYFVEIARSNLDVYVIGWERGYHHAMRTFKLSRMRRAEVTSERYGIPDSFDPKAYLSNAWGVIGSSDTDPVLVRVRFAPEVSERLEEGGIPNAVTQEKVVDGWLEVTIRAGVDDQGLPRELLPWVLSWGQWVDVLEPAVLREAWLENLRGALSRHN
jgi:predicted DNA-binding transcriptional regulator YafY